MKSTKILLSTACVLFSAGVLTSGLLGNNHSLEVKASTTETVSGTKLQVEDSTGKGWTYSGVDPIAMISNVTFADNSGYPSMGNAQYDLSIVQKFVGKDIHYATSSTKIEAGMTWFEEKDGARKYIIEIPWFFESFSVEFCAPNNDGDRYVYDKAYYNSSVPTRYSFNVSKGKHYCIKFKNGGWADDAYWDDGRFVTYVDTQTVISNNWTYSESKYSVTIGANTAFGGSITPAAGEYEYYKNQRLTLVATADSFCSFSSWSDDGAAEHVVYVTEDATYTATFSGTAALLANKLNAYDVSVSGKCGDADRFPACKEYYLALDSDEQTAFQGYSAGTNEQKSAYQRYVNWAAALGEKEFEEGVLNSFEISPVTENAVNPAIIGLVVIGITTVALGGFFVLRWNKQE